MAYSEKEIKSTFQSIIEKIEQGNSLRSVLREDKMPSSQTFFKWIDQDEAKSKQYARACEKRADAIFEEILNIADDQEDDVYEDHEGNIITNHNVIQRARLRVDSRKWMLGKMNPKKYGESSLLKLGNNEGDELKINAIFTTDLVHVPTDDGTT